MRPIVKGGQGRASGQVKLDAISAVWMLAAAALLVALVFAPGWLLAVVAAVVLILAVTVAVATAPRIDAQVLQDAEQHIDVHG